MTPTVDLHHSAKVATDQTISNLKAQLMPRKKASDTANTDADSKSVEKTQGSEQGSDETTAKKTTRRRRITADDILGKEEDKASTEKPKTKARTAKAKASDEAAEEKPKTAAKSKSASKSTTSKTTAKKAPAKKAPAKKAAEVKEEPVVEEKPSKKLFGRRTLADEVEEEKKAPKKPAAKKAPAKEEPKEEAKPAAKAESKASAKAEKEEPKKKAPATKKSSPKKEGLDDDSPYTVSIELSWRKPDAPVASSAPAKAKEPVVVEDEVSEPAEEPEYEPIDLGDEEGRMRILTWRSSSVKQKKADGESRLAPRKSRSKRRRDLPEGEISAADAYNEEVKPRFRKRGEEDSYVEEPQETDSEPVEEVVAKKAEPVPEVPVREPIARREEAAQVVVHEDHPKIIKDKVAYAPFVFYAGALEGKGESLVAEEIKLSAEHGIHLFMFNFDMETGDEQVQSLTDSILKQAKKCLELAPEAQILVRLNFVPSENWQKKFPDARDLSATVGQNVPSLCDDAYWQATEKDLTKLIEGLRESDLSDSLMGVHLDRNRWEFNPADGYDTSVAAQTRFRSWLRHRYRNDVVTLRASWFDGKVDFDNADIPEPGFTDKAGEFVRTDRKARRWIDYHLFLSDMTVERIGELCYAAKAASDGDFLVGVTYGSTFESSHPASGQLSLGKLLRCPELDYISAAPNYEKIAPGSAAPFPFPVDSFALNGKLFMIEEDYRTPISGQSDDDNAPLMRTPQALEAVHWRGAGASLAHRGGLIWCDHKGKGWLNSRGIWERGAKIRETLLRNLTTPTSNPEAAVFIDERSLTYLADEQSFVSLIQDVRESALRSGLSVGFYLLSDLAHRENFPEAKLHVFLNAWDMRPEVRSAIKSRLQRDGKVLFWLYTAGLFEAGRESLERVREVTGIALRPQPFNSKSGTTVLNTTEPLGQAIPQDELSEGGKLEPSYFAIPEDGNIIAEYTSTGLPSLLVKPFEGDKTEQNWTSVFLGEPMVTPSFFRALGQLAGCHVWNFDNDIVHAAAPNLTIHCTETGSRTITLPNKWVAFDLKAADYMPVENNTVKFKALDGASYSFVVGTIGDVQKIVKADIDTIRKITSPIIRDENTLHWDTIRFDVEIMRLDEWVEETWSEELADDLLLKPSLLDVDSEALMEEMDEEPDVRRSEPGRRRRRKRRGGGRRSDRRSDFDHGGSSDDDGIGVLFRKRD